MRIKTLFLSLGMLLSLFLPYGASADVFEPGTKIRLGGFWAHLDTKINARIPKTDIGQEIDFESDLFLEKSKFSPLLGITYRFNENHAVQLQYFSPPPQNLWVGSGKK